MFERIKLIALLIRHRTFDPNKIIDKLNKESERLKIEHKAMLERKKAEKKQKKK